ncbi:PREDICTED: solute carrier family 35 member G1-like [Branchiostoma belcheri]|uniref:Solute carrier family 35 member G1-like n=1 Tax=Branchiostoma belcheri TaxID=7741 RepID=A0A6P4ZH98_BRABE|nr:PREDICTED: solute carrier family 35 member G1-like [Branchiostoma belcheri]
MMLSNVEEEDLEEEAIDSRKASLKAARGPLLSIGATILFAISSEMTALSSKDGIPGFQLMFFLRLSQILVLLVCFLIFRPKLIGENKHQNGLLFLETVVNNVATTLMYLSFTYASPGIAFGIIQGSMPLFTACLGFIFLKEKIGLIPCCGILISIIGVILVSIGMAKHAVGPTNTMVVSILLPLAAAFSKGPDMVLSRAIIKDMSGITMLLYITIPGTVAQLILTYSFETPVWVMSAKTAWYIAGLGLSQAVAMLFFLGVMKVEKAAIAVALRALVIPLTILLDYLILSKVPNAIKWGGLSLVILGTLGLGIYTWWEHHQEEKRKTLLKKMDFPQLIDDTK